jgi:hypothetical protein
MVLLSGTREGAGRGRSEPKVSGAKRVRLLVFVGTSPIPYCVDGVLARGIPPDDLHIHFTPAQLQILMSAVGEHVVGRATKAAGEALGAAVVDAVQGWQSKRRGRKLKR